MILRGLQRYPFARPLLALTGGILCGDVSPHALPLGLFLVVGLLLWVGMAVGLRYHRGKLFGAFALSMFFLIGYTLVGEAWARTSYSFSGNPSFYKIYVQEKPEWKERSILCRSRLLQEYCVDSIIERTQPPLFLLYFPQDSAAAALKRGDILLIHATLAPPKNNGNPDEFDYARYLRRNGGSGTAYVPSGSWRLVAHDSIRSLRQAALDCRDEVVGLYRNLGFEGDELAVLSALTVGDKDELSEDIIETYSVSGASHVLALSGLHIGFLYLLFWCLFRFFWSRWSWLKPFFLLLIVALLWCFAFITGLSSTVVRSVVMFSLLTLSSMQYERPVTLNTLAATAFLMLLFRPFWLFDLGFQLSFLAVLAIAVIQPRLYAFWPVKFWPMRYVWGLITVSISAQLVVAPLILLCFSRFSTHFLLTNLWVVPVSSLVMYAAVILLLLTPFPVLQQVFAGWVEWLVRLQNEVLRSIENLPYSSIDGIWLDSWSVLLIYLGLLAACVCYVRRSARSVMMVLSLSVVFVAWLAFTSWRDAPVRSLAFYNVRGCPSVHCIEADGRSWLVCADSVPQISRMYLSLSKHWYRMHLDSLCVVSGEQRGGLVELHDGMMVYAGKSVYFLRDRRWRWLQTDKPLPVDYLYVCRGYRGRLSELCGVFDVGAVVFEPSYSDYYREQIIQDCFRSGIPYYALDETGALMIPL